MTSSDPASASAPDPAAGDTKHSAPLAEPPQLQHPDVAVFPFHGKRPDNTFPSRSSSIESQSATPPPSYFDSVSTPVLQHPQGQYTSEPLRTPFSQPAAPTPQAQAPQRPPAIPEDPVLMSPTTPSQPSPPTVVETQPSVATLKKTRAPRRNGQHKHQDGPSPTLQPPATRQNVVSAPTRLRKPPSRDSSPSSSLLPRGRSTSAHPWPAIMTGSALSPGPSQAPFPLTATLSSGSNSLALTPADAERGDASSQTRRSWLPSLGGGSRSKSRSHEPSAAARSPAWVFSADSRPDYNIHYLLNCEKVPELWDDNGELHVYLAPPYSEKGASFKVRVSVIEQSRVLTDMVQNHPSSPPSARSRARSFGSRDTLMAADACRPNGQQPASPPPFAGYEYRLHLPVGTEGGTPDIDRLIALRNLFALLTGQPLVATQQFPTMFAALRQVADLLREFEFGMVSDGSNSFGEAVDLSTGFCIDQTGLADVRLGREKTLEALILAEQLRYWPLFNEAFCHAVGKYAALRELKNSPLWDLASPNTLQRLERAHLDLLTRQHSVNTRLEQFEFPSLFAGIASSTSHPEYRSIRFKNWRAAFSEMRSFTLKYYKTKFGSWPPKASSKRNPFSESGLNRLVLKTLYADLCSVYDLLVNRKSITTRVGEGGAVFDGSPSADTDAEAAPSAFTHQLAADSSMKALRQVLGEFDMSSPPVLPPIPFDIPKLPTMTTIHETFCNMSPKDQARFEKNIQTNELLLIMLKSHNVDAERAGDSPFLAAFEAFELHEAKRSKTELELIEMRIGHWLFLYVVLQSMPMLVVDAPGLRFCDGVEYFLCKPPQGRPPWVEDAGEIRKAWFQTAGGSGPLVELSADVLLYSVEATYHRSHCWLVAKQWDAEAPRGSISAMDVGSDDLVAAQGSEGVTSVNSPGIPFPVQSTGLSEPTPLLPGLGVSASSPSLLGMASSSATPSTTSSPLRHPSGLEDYEASSRSVSPGVLLPGQALGRHSPQIPSVSNLQQSPLIQPRDNYEQLQQRARLRHASIGWKLEPVNLVRGLSPPPVLGANARRVASAGNLRAMAEVSSYRQSNASMVSFVNASASSNNLGSPLQHYNVESTFDSILSGIEDAESRKKKKRGTFLPFR